MESKNLFFYELEGRGYTFQNKNWDEAKHGFEDDMLNMAWEMWSSGQAAKAQAVPEGFVLVPKEPTKEMIEMGDLTFAHNECVDATKIYKAMIEAQEQSND